jgi:hypothetical protein
VIRAQAEFLNHVFNKVEKLAHKKAAPEAVDNLVTPLLGNFKVPASRHQKYARRLRYGLYHYYARHYHPTSNMQEE